MILAPDCGDGVADNAAEVGVRGACLAVLSTRRRRRQKCEGERQEYLWGKERRLVAEVSRVLFGSDLQRRGAGQRGEVVLSWDYISKAFS